MYIKWYTNPIFPRPTYNAMSGSRPELMMADSTQLARIEESTSVTDDPQYISTAASTEKDTIMVDNPQYLHIDYSNTGN